MFFTRDLRVRLQDRRDRLLRQGFYTYQSELSYFIQFLQQDHYLRSLLMTLEATVSMDFNAWDHTERMVFPPTEQERAFVCWKLISKCAEGSPDKILNWGYRANPDAGNIDGAVRQFTETYVDSLVDYLHDRVAEADNVRYLLERFKMRCEWFRKDELYRQYLADTQHGEDNLDRELRAWLFDGGIDYPFSSPSSPSGKADIVALLETDNPLVLESKVYDPEKGREKPHLRQGFHQVLSYARDYNKNVGYLVVFNMSDRVMLVSPDGTNPSDPPVRIEYGGKTIFPISVDLNPNALPASKDDPKTRVVLTEQELV